ncbi:MAG: condensation domain-containing protein, partial [Polyangiaceae bacterium]
MQNWSSALWYWTTHLDGAPSALDLPADYPRAPLSARPAGSATRALANATAGALRDLARAEGASVLDMMLAAYAAVLGRLSGQKDVVIGTPILSSTLPIRVDLDSSLSFRALVCRAREAMNDAREHALPFDSIVEAVRAARDPRWTPIF